MVPGWTVLITWAEDSKPCLVLTLAFLTSTVCGDILSSSSIKFCTLPVAILWTTIWKVRISWEACDIDQCPRLRKR
eukprot:7551565-Heterocapsa_arctica.AAC.1